MSNEEKIFADGFITKRNEKAPDFVLANHSVKVDEFVAFLQKHQNNGWVNLDTLKSQNGKIYTQLSTWKPEGESKDSTKKEDTDDIPF